MATNSNELMKLLLAQKIGLGIGLGSYSETTTITTDKYGKKTVVTQRSGFINNAWEHNGQRYLLDDPTAVNRMSGKDRELFWAVCDEKAKDCDLYRAYAEEKLANAKINLEDLPSPEAKLLALNNATSLETLAKYCLSQGYTNWFRELTGQDIKQFEVLITHADQIKKLIGRFKKTRLSKSFTSITSVKTNEL
ncbi:hypothetical protein A8135_09430 [Legionella jamestowniensis]|uniref:Uncharacterized protein n=1 Tax=Legionella jamestowniensis TaxID=455 RepID=A0ABX2XX25_9GAMM|nr:hypothetical protein [Legionella jamestowniensis]OCH98967.1 hypothetical protein A8135_09430 [Legionella jamestowniensis]